MRGITLGQVITKGSPIANTGVPGVVGGESLRRLLKAPKSGLFKACAKLGDLVRAGDTVAYVDDEPVKVLIDGKLRGLIRTGTLVKEREKVGDCDPRGESVDIYTISDKARAIGGGVLEAVVSQIWRQLAISN
jgi:xanthine dehydrogenase accessory factor